MKCFLFVFLHTLRISRARPLPRIIGGQDAVSGTYPFFASLTFNQSHSCGGTLVAQDIILSAAHCINLEHAELGRSRREDPNDNYETFDLIQEIRHPVYSNETYRYDFMILKLDRPAPDHIKPIRINKDKTLPTVGVPDGVKAIGFGVMKYFYDSSHGDTAQVLQEVGLQVITNEQCMTAKDGGSSEEAYANGYDGLIEENMLCAEDDGQDTCFGDSGGPLMISESDEYVQVGITSWGFGCGDDAFPGVYSRISHQYEWVRMTVCELSVHPPDYFECDAPTLAPAQNVEVTLAITFDNFPGEISFVIIDDTGFGVTFIEFPAESFSDNKPGSTFYETYTMKERSTYTFIINDARGDGLCCFEEGTYRLFVGTKSKQGRLLVSGGGNFGSESVHVFTVPVGDEVQVVNSNSSHVSQLNASSSPMTNNLSGAPTISPIFPTTAAPSLQSTNPSTTVPSDSPTITPSPTRSPTKAPSNSPTSSPTESMSPSEAPTTVPRAKNTAQLFNIIFGVLVVVAVAAVFLVTSWYADHYNRLRQVQNAHFLEKTDQQNGTRIGDNPS